MSARAERPAARAPSLAAIALGGNLGDRREHLERAVLEIAAIPGVRLAARSAWHDTEPEGGASEPRYLNGVVLVETTLAPRELLERLLAIERAHGRVRGTGTRSRTLDLDLLVHGDARVDEPGLTVPHPRIEGRAFVLAPLAEIAPDLRLPSGLTAAERLAALGAPGSRAAPAAPGTSAATAAPGTGAAPAAPGACADGARAGRR